MKFFPSPTAWATLLITPAALFLTLSSVSAQDASCRTAMATHFEDTSPEMNAAVERLQAADRDRVFGLAHCDAKHFNLGKVFEATIRTLDTSSMGTPNASLFISASQTLTVQEPKRAFPRTTLNTSLSEVPAAKPYLGSVKLPPKAQAWRGVLSELNAKTHALQAWTSLLSKNLLDSPTSLSSKPADELAFAMLTTAAYLQHARSEKPPVFTSLAASESSVDAFKLLWTRAEETLQASQDLKLGQNTDDLLKATYAYLPAVQDLFRMSGRAAPTFLFKERTQPKDPVIPKGPPAEENPTAEATTPSENSTDPTKTPEDPPSDAANNTDPTPSTEPIPTAPAVAGSTTATPATEDPTKAPDDLAKDPEDPPTSATAQSDPKPLLNPSKDPSDTPSTSPKTPEDPPTSTTQTPPTTDPPKDTKTPPKQDTPKPDDAKKDDAKKDDAKKDDSPPTEESLSTINIVRLVIAGIILLIPWILVLVLFLRKRKNDLSWVRLSNRFIALATFILLVEVCAVGAFAVSFEISSLARLDGLYLFAPVYIFAVLLLMVRKLDSEDSIVTLQMLKRWTKWGLPILIVLIIANAIMSFWPFIGTWSFPITAGIIAIALSIFMVRLWRVGNQPTEDTPIIEPSPEPNDPTPPEPAPKPSKTPKTDPKPTPKDISIQPKPTPKTSPATPEGEKTGMEAMSDDDFAALFEAMDDGSDDSKKS